MVEFNGAVVVAAVAALSGFMGMLGANFYARLKNRREEHAEQREDKNADMATALALKDEIITALKEQNALITKQLEESLAREKRAHAELGKLRARVAKIEEGNTETMRSVLEAYAESDRCEVKDCMARKIPGERRAKDDAQAAAEASIKAGGTDTE
jgi:cell division protein FtsB